MPALRQAAPVGSRFVEPVTDCHWKCKLCKSDILAAVISAGAIRHYRIVHPELLEEMQYELCKVLLFSFYILNGKLFFPLRALML